MPKGDEMNDPSLEERVLLMEQALDAYDYDDFASNYRDLIRAIIASWREREPAAEAMRAKCEAIARSFMHYELSNPAEQIADEIAALKETVVSSGIIENRTDADQVVAAELTFGGRVVASWKSDKPMSADELVKWGAEMAPAVARINELTQNGRVIASFMIEEILNLKPNRTEDHRPRSSDASAPKP
jgi:hypothetical protein